MRSVRESVFAIVAASCLAPAAAQVNLGFEAGSEGLPAGWSTGGDGFEFALDQETRFEGESSLRVRRARLYEPGLFGVVSQTLDATALHRHRAHVEAAVKTEGVDIGYAVSGYASTATMACCSWTP